MPSKKVTKAGGTGPGGMAASTPAVICTFCPRAEGFGEPETSIVVAPNANAWRGDASTSTELARTASTNKETLRNPGRRL